MNEDDLRAALRTTITLNPEPPPMTSASALAAARRSARRRNVLAGAGAAVALAAVAVAIVPLRDALGEPSILVAGPPSAPAPTGTPDPEDTKPSWPAEASGDATYDSGVHYQKGKALLKDVIAVAPDGYEAKDGYHQAAVVERGIAYLAHTDLAKGGRTGQLLVEVYQPGEGLPQDACELAESFWDRGGGCKVSTVGGKRVGVVTAGPDQGLDQWAAYRHEDGTVVFVGQGRSVDQGGAALKDLPFDVPSLADLATDQRFLLN